MSFQRLNTCFLLSALLVPTMGTAGEPTRWSTYQGSVEHTGFVDIDTGVPISAQPRWARKLVPDTLPAGGTYIGLAIADQRVYVTSPERFTAVNPIVAASLTDGTVLWEQNFPYVNSVNPPAVSGSGSVFLVTGKSTGSTVTPAQLHRLDGASGRVIFSVPLEAQWQRYYAPTIIGNMVTTAGGFYSGIYAFSQRGTELYQAGMFNYDQWTPVPWRNFWLVLSQTLNLVDRTTGEAQSSIVIPEPGSNTWSTGQTPVVLGDIAYMTQNNRLVAIDLVKGEVKFIRSASDFNVSNIDGQISTDGKLLFFRADSQLVVVDRAGMVIDRYGSGPEAGFGPTNIVTRSHVFGWWGNGQVNMFDRSNCQMVQSFHSPTGRDVAAMALADGELVVAYRDGYVAAFDIPFYRTDSLFANGFESTPSSTCSSPPKTDS